METKKVDIFGSFLAGTPAASLAPPAGAPLADAQLAPAPSPDLEKALIALLARATQPVDLKILLAQTLGSPTQVIQILDDLVKVGLVQRVDQEGDGDGRSYQATPLGKNLYSSQ